MHFSGDGAKRTCFRGDILTKTATERDETHRDFLLFCLFASSSFFLLFFLFILFFYYPPIACVLVTEMFAELLCGAVALVLYVNTLGADFCYDDRYHSDE